MEGGHLRCRWCRIEEPLFSIACIDLDKDDTLGELCRCFVRHRKLVHEPHEKYVGLLADVLFIIIIIIIIIFLVLIRILVIVLVLILILILLLLLILILILILIILKLFLFLFLFFLLYIYIYIYYLKHVE